jgi:hypothetical protein
MIYVHVGYVEGEPGIATVFAPHVPENVREWVNRAIEKVKVEAAAEREQCG